MSTSPLEILEDFQSDNIPKEQGLLLSTESTVPLNGSASLCVWRTASESSI
ncbi:MAG: hypothetical protein ACK57Y_10850 [Pirellulaceae bacterium]|jgi:hypothetical protein